MVWPYWHNERWTIIGCGKPRQVCNALKKWVRDRQKASVVGRTNNQAPALKPTHEQRCVHLIYESTYVKSEANSCLCRRFAKKTYN
jgi:hypothetical protein